jgi:asparagine synthase (glutamine-hydrolysing)
MASSCGRYVLIFNGEIYNHLDLRKSLKLPRGSDGDWQQWRGSSDTETLLACIAAWGFEKALHATVGMFALALWDRAERTLYLGRDRFGEKPLHYGFVGKSFIFASEVGAIATVPGFDGEIDRQAIALYLQFSYIPAPRTIYRGLTKLQPGTWLSISFDQAIRRETPKTTTYWSAIERAQLASQTPLRFSSENAAVESLDELLKEAVRGQMVADVPIGAFLSGGIDSSVVVALMQAQNRRKVTTFSLGFNAAGYDEAPYARAVARHLGTDHVEMYVGAADAIAAIPELPRIYDEPFSDSSQLPTYLVAKLARKQVIVSLSGDGGDELFGGYWRHFFAAQWWQFLSRIPRPVRRAAGAWMLRADTAAWDRVYGVIAPLIPRHLRWSNPGDRFHKAARILSVEDGVALYHRLTRQWASDEQACIEQGSESRPHIPEMGTLAELMMALDAASYLSDDILVKLDRAAMAVSLETRAPFLDHRVYEFAWRLPLNYKVRGKKGKWILRRVLDRYVPAALSDRPKMGFGVPIGDWLRGPLKEWAEELLNEIRLKQEGFFDPALIRQKWQEHISGRRNWQHQLWSVLMFQAWYERRLK